MDTLDSLDLPTLSNVRYVVGKPLIYNATPCFAMTRGICSGLGDLVLVGLPFDRGGRDGSAVDSQRIDLDPRMLSVYALCGHCLATIHCASYATPACISRAPPDHLLTVTSGMNVHMTERVRMCALKISILRTLMISSRREHDQ